MFQVLMSIAAIVFLWKQFQEWREKRWVQRTLAPGAGLTRGIKRPLVWRIQFVFLLAVISITAFNMIKYFVTH